MSMPDPPDPQEAPANRKGRLLVASPSLSDPNFRRAVVLLSGGVDIEPSSAP